MTNIFLSKIARGASTDSGSIHDDAQVFEHNGRVWSILPVFSEDVDKLLDIIKLDANGELKGICFVESHDQNHLMIQYNNFLMLKTSPLEDDVVHKLFQVLFQKPPSGSYFSVCPAEEPKPNRILKTYVTSKLFELLKMQHDAAASNIEDICITLPARFMPKLCKYQERTLRWILSRERVKAFSSGFFEQMVPKTGETILYKRLYDRLIQNTPPEAVLIPPGGILAEEMGLGKTVEMLALVVLNPRRHVTPLPDLCFADTKRQRLERTLFCICRSKSVSNIIQCPKCSLYQHSKCVLKHNKKEKSETPYFCPACWQAVVDENGLIKSGATLIVSPNTIKLQWMSEIKRHIQPSLRVFLYEGIVSGKWISPGQLCDYDIVLTDYNVLRGEVYHTAENVSDRITRNKPVSIRMHTPLLMIEWWRTVLDEAQMVESNTSKVAALVRTIPAINRWAVTGTPIQRSLYDLQPLMQFMGFEHAAEPSTWHFLVHDFLQKYESTARREELPLVKVLQKCMWRTCKSDIHGELQIPPQEEVVHRIHFDNIEKLFYNEQHRDCEESFLQNVSQYTKGMKSVSPQIMKRILHPFLKIRQSCTMPVVTNTHATSSISSHHKQYLQPQELHAYLKSSNELSCKSELRAMASSLNGLASLYLLQGKHEEAIKHYQAVLKISKDYIDNNLTVDSLLQIHALHNLMQVLRSHSVTDNDSMSSLEEQHHSLEWKYLGTYSSTLTTVKAGYHTALAKSEGVLGNHLIEFIAEGLERLGSADKFSLLQKILDESLPRFSHSNLKVNEIDSLDSVLYVVHIWFEKLRGTLSALRQDMESLTYFSENIKPRKQVDDGTWNSIMNLVESVYDCHLKDIREAANNQKVKPNDKPKKKICRLCEIRGAINNFECLIFDKVIDKNTNFTEGLENPSLELFTCKLICGSLKSKHSDQILASKMDRNLACLENLQILCKRLIKVWIETEYAIKAYDELNMCKMRITLTDEQDDKSVYKIRRHEIDQRILDNRNEFESAQREFTRKLARLKYIKHLESNEDLGPCPICQLEDEKRIAVLECGHHICIQCLKASRMYTKVSQFKCSVCRNEQQIQHVHYVCRTKRNTSGGEPIRGSFSSKIAYIVRLILKLTKEEHEAHPEHGTKILIYSQWMPILTAIAGALRENDISFRIQCSPKTLEEFKDTNLGISCLLMPYVSGSKGLNLVEATHVFLVEPILNPGEELQAVGRVHRFGQTRPTTVHRFITSDSIEENIFNFISSSLQGRDTSTNGMTNKWEFSNMSLDDFKNLFSLQPRA